jgi:AraC-like DNA-binding protein
MRAIHESRSYAGNLPAVVIESKNMTFYAHWHEDVELLCVCEGSLRVGINNESRTLRRGDVAVCASGDIHFYDGTGTESILRLIIFRPEIIDSAGGWPQKFEFGSPFLQGLSLSDLFCRFNAAFDTIRQETHKSDAVSLMMIRGSLLNLCAMLARTVLVRPASPTKASGRNHRLKGMQDALGYIERNYAEDIRLKDAAAVANMSVFHFSRLFGSIAGAGFRSYLNYIRVMEAENMLRNSEDSITEIAYRCGFNSIRTFNRLFRALRGMPPSGMRR